MQRWSDCITCRFNFGQVCDINLCPRPKVKHAFSGCLTLGGCLLLVHSPVCGLHGQMLSASWCVHLHAVECEAAGPNICTSKFKAMVLYWEMVDWVLSSYQPKHHAWARSISVSLLWSFYGAVMGRDGPGFFSLYHMKCWKSRRRKFIASELQWLFFVLLGYVKLMPTTHWKTSKDSQESVFNQRVEDFAEI